MMIIRIIKQLLKCVSCSTPYQCDLTEIDLHLNTLVVVQLLSSITVQLRYRDKLVLAEC